MSIKNFVTENKKQIGFTALSVLLLLLLANVIPFGNSICFRDDQGRELTKIPLNHGNYFNVEFRHSVNKGLVIEEFHVDNSDRSLHLATGWFESFGAGMMDTLEPDMIMTEDQGMIRIDFPEKKVDHVTYTAAGIADHIFNYGDEHIHLFDQWPYKSVAISVDRINMFEYLNYVIRM